jgi:hypothetical protein
MPSYRSPRKQRGRQVEETSRKLGTTESALIAEFGWGQHLNGPHWAGGWPSRAKPFPAHRLIIRGMKLQFSLTTLLAVTTALAIDSAVCALIGVPEIPVITVTETFGIENIPSSEETVTSTAGEHAPNLIELSRRLAWSAPLSIGVTVGVLWTIRRLKSQRENGPPVG